MTALVLSAGGMYGAYQAGAWRVLADVFRPDLIVGASIGALNGWAIAGGCDPDELVQRWLTLNSASRYRWKVPRSPFQGVLDTRALQASIRDIHASYPPHAAFALVITDLMKLRPRVLRGTEVTWRHLMASAALPVLFDQVRVDGRIYSDGGLLEVAPIWAAAELGATKALVIDVLPSLPRHMGRPLVKGMRRLSRFRPLVPPTLRVVRIGPERLLGKPIESIRWTRANAEAWIHAGEEEAAAIKHSIANCFERE